MRKEFVFFGKILCLSVCAVLVAGAGRITNEQQTRALIGVTQQKVIGSVNKKNVDSVQPKQVSEKKSSIQESVDIDKLLFGVRDKCSGIAEELNQVKKMATVNTVVTGAGTVAGGVALYAGIKKSSLDKQVEELEKKLEQLSSMSDEEFFRFLKRMSEYQDNLEQYKNTCAEKQNLVKKSKDMGNLRTGMMAANTVTAVAGTVIAGSNETEGRSIAARITDCKHAVDKLKNQMEQSRVSGDINTHDKLESVVSACSKMYSNDLEEIYANSNVAKISSAVNIGTGVVGTVTSVVANTDKVRSDNSTAGKEKEKNLNTAANVFAGASTIASGVSTVFNAKTIKAINNNIEFANKCEEALK